MPTPLADIIDVFQSVDVDTRLDLLLDYSRQLPTIPERFNEARDEGLGRVEECMTPVFLWTEKENSNLRIYADVAEEAPTVKGFVSILVSAFDNSPCDEVAAAPPDLLKQLGLDGKIRMNRVVGLSAILMRIKKAAA